MNFDQFYDAIERHMHAPFAWGVSDCWQLFVDCQLALGRADPYPQQTGAYFDAKAYRRVLNEAGFVDLRQALAAVYESIDGAFAQRGDVALIDTGHDGLMCAVVDGSSLIAKAKDGASVVPLERGVHFFRTA